MTLATHSRDILSSSKMLSQSIQTIQLGQFKCPASGLPSLYCNFVLACVFCFTFDDRTMAPRSSWHQPFLCTTNALHVYFLEFQGRNMLSLSCISAFLNPGSFSFCNIFRSVSGLMTCEHSTACFSGLVWA